MTITMQRLVRIFMLLALATGGFVNMTEVGGQTAAQSIQRAKQRP